MTTAQIDCPYCHSHQQVANHNDYRPYYVNCPDCARRFIAEPVQNGTVVYREGEAPCCSDPECRETEMGDSGQD